MATTFIERLHWKVLASAAWVLALVVLLGFVAVSSDQPNLVAQAPAKVELPPDLALVPPDAVFFVHMRVAELWNSEAGKKLRAQMPKEAQEAQREFEKGAGLALADLDRITVLLVEPPPRGDEPLLIASTTTPIERDKLLRVILREPQERQHAGKTYYHSKESKANALHFVSDRLFVSGHARALESFLERPVRPGTKGPLSAALELAATKHHAVAGFHLPKDLVGAVRQQQDNLPPDFRWLLPLLELQHVILTLDFAEETRVEVRLQFPDEATAKRGASAAKDGLALARTMGLTPALAEIEKGRGILGKNDIPHLFKLLKEIDKAMQNAAVEQQGAAVHIGLRINSDIATVNGATAEAVVKVREAANRMRNANNLKQMGIAFHMYHTDYKRLPSDVYSPDGKPLLSWRVLILPYMEQDPLYKLFKLDEPWDSPNNKKLLANMPSFYAPVGVETKEPHTTFYQGFVGKGCAFEPNQKVTFAHFIDGTTHTILLVEAGEPVPWTKPGDMPYVTGQPFPKLGGLFKGGFNALFGDGSVRFLKKDTDIKKLHLLIIRNDRLPAPDLDD